MDGDGALNLRSILTQFLFLASQPTGRRAPHTPATPCSPSDFTCRTDLLLAIRCFWGFGGFFWLGFTSAGLEADWVEVRQL